LFTGRAPKTKLFPHDWFDSPNIHFFTVEDFESLAQLQNWTIEKRIFLQGARQIAFLPNLLAEVAVFLVKSS
jgi:methionine biosynthesis protein MetW